MPPTADEVPLKMTIMFYSGHDDPDSHEDADDLGSSAGDADADDDDDGFGESF